MVSSSHFPGLSTKLGEQKTWVLKKSLQAILSEQLLGLKAFFLLVSDFIEFLLLLEILQVLS